MRFGYIDENGNLQEPTGMLPGVERSFTDENGELITGRYQCGYDPDNTPPHVVSYLLENGYLPVYETEPEEPAGEGKHYEAIDWAEGEANGAPAILQIWAIVDDLDPGEQEISAERAVEIIMTGRDSYASNSE